MPELNVLSPPITDLSRARDLSVEFDPRTLVATLSADLRSEQALSCPLEAIFIPCRGRPAYLVQLLDSLPDQGIPIFLLPTEPNDTIGCMDSRVRILESVDSRLLEVLQSMRCCTSRLCEPFTGNWDLPQKRNHAIWYAKKRHYQRILLLDDDIRGLNRDHLNAGTASLSQVMIAGFVVDDFPDTSAIRHVSAAKGDPICPFLSGSCLFVRTDDDVNFFPPIYNEDWLFMLPQIVKGRVASLGRIQQLSHDPFAFPERARFQEAGETIVDGLFALVTSNRYDERFDASTWHEFLNLRRRWLRDLAQRSDSGPATLIINAALSSSDKITAKECIQFINDWETDLSLWRSALQEIA